ncbi:hypothetical protein JNJ66_04895 [Candidatus Saccharibacteria bacterium]|nr:hypothetical protein [Candidatus Saccharibacteria bacterium]
MTTHSAASRHYFEDRQRHMATATADMMRHFAYRYLNGKALVLTGQPEAVQRQAERQWLRQSATLQQLRSATTDANDILELTVRITRMQRTGIVAGRPPGPASAGMWITDILPDRLPTTCRSLYLLDIPASERRRLKPFVIRAPRHALLVDYTGAIAPRLANWPLSPKSDLEAIVLNAWHELEAYLHRHEIDLPSLLPHNPDHFELFDDALDTLLDTGSQFLKHAYQFQDALQLAEPFPYQNNRQRETFDIAGLLTKRVSALTPSIFNRYFSNLEESDEFFLQDGARAEAGMSRQIARHYARGRKRLAAALELYVSLRQGGPLAALSV